MKLFLCQKRIVASKLEGHNSHWVILGFSAENLNEKKFYGNYTKYYINAYAMMQIYNLDTKKACIVIPGIELL